MSTFNALVVEQIPRLRRYARALTGDRERADDLVQDCLERACSRGHMWQRGTDIRAWLFTVMHNIHANQARRYNNGPDFIPLEDHGSASAVSMNHGSGLELRDLQTAIAALPAEQREVLLLVCVEEMKYEEVADLLEVPAGTVMSRLHRARERLRVLIQGTGRPGLRRVK